MGHLQGWPFRSEFDRNRTRSTQKHQVEDAYLAYITLKHREAETQILPPVKEKRQMSKGWKTFWNVLLVIALVSNPIGWLILLWTFCMMVSEIDLVFPVRVTPDRHPRHP